MRLPNGQLSYRFIKSALAWGVLSTQIVLGKSPRAQLDQPIHFQGVGDASAAVAIGARFFITASDEEHQLRVYNRDAGGPPVSTFELAPYLSPHKAMHQLDLEGAARIGSRVFWIGSHSRNQEGQRRAASENLFAVEVLRLDPAPVLQFVGQPYTRLLEDLCASSIGRKFHLREATKADPRSREGLNIEGMSSSEDQHLWIGFRTPIPQRLALLVEITNPNALTSGQRAVFGRAITLDLDGLGIRDLAFDGRRYYILAGAHDGKDKAALFRWNGRDDAPKRFKLPQLQAFNPEAIAIFDKEKPEAIYLFTDSGHGKDRTRKEIDNSFECLRVEVSKTKPAGPGLQ